MTAADSLSSVSGLGRAVDAAVKLGVLLEVVGGCNTLSLGFSFFFLIGTLDVMNNLETTSRVPHEYAAINSNQDTSTKILNVEKYCSCTHRQTAHAPYTRTILGRAA